MKEDTRVHFGWWMLWQMKRRGFGRMKDLSIASGLSERQLWRLVELPEPVGILSKTLVGLTQAFQIQPEQFDSTWRHPVSMPPEIKQREREATAPPRVSVLLEDINRIVGQIDLLLSKGTKIPPPLQHQLDQLSASLSKLKNGDKVRMTYGDRVVTAEQLQQQRKGAASTDPQTARINREKRKRRDK